MTARHKSLIILSHIHQLGYAVNRTEWRGQVEYTAWPRLPGAAVLTAVASSFNEHHAVRELRRRIEGHAQAIIECPVCRPDCDA